MACAAREGAHRDAPAARSPRGAGRAPRPRPISTRLAFGESWIPAPTSLKPVRRSIRVTAWPARIEGEGGRQAADPGADDGDGSVAGTEASPTRRLRLAADLRSSQTQIAGSALPRP